MRLATASCAVSSAYCQYEPLLKSGIMATGESLNSCRCCRKSGLSLTKGRGNKLKHKQAARDGVGRTLRMSLRPIEL